MLLLAAFKFFFDLVESVEMMPFYDDINQHPRVCIWIEDQGGSSYFGWQFACKERAAPKGFVIFGLLIYVWALLLVI